ncbi:hypothetical protein UFOVP202_55 [uncultured Caudovirales phage]|uniref:Uncharacterized protein n=1 Tax=uncultured Caudovirales phage TaxID=2100421 RepID=A0A6J7WN86_9CAUD|nr:hypothetical protein UFOVP202_55 [uncultured Caudovirales phage]
MFIISWVFDKLGYMPKISVDANWPFPATQKEYKPHPDEVKPKKAVKKTVKIAKATTRTPKTKK